MKNGFKIVRTNNALNELENTFEYLEKNWSEKDLRNLSDQIEIKISLISKNPFLFQSSDFKKDIRRIVILKHNTLYYKLTNDCIEILSFFSNRQNPKKIKI